MIISGYSPMTLLALVVAAVLAEASPAQADGNEAEARFARLREREAQYSAGFLHKDATLLAKVLAEDFIDTSPNAKVVRKADYLIGLKDPSWRLDSLEETEVVYLVRNESAVVTARFVVRGVEEGKPFVQEGRSTDAWIWEKGDWWCVAAHSSLVSK